MITALVMFVPMIAGLLAIGRAGELRSGRWAVAGVVLLAAAYLLP